MPMTIKFNKAVYILLLAAAVPELLAQNAFAYLDPGTGSFVFQALVAAFLGSLFALKTFWGKITAFARGLFTARRPPPAP
jgi:hypothetical protein